MMFSRVPKLAKVAATGAALGEPAHPRMYAMASDWPAAAKLAFSARVRRETGKAVKARVDCRDAALASLYQWAPTGASFSATP